MLDLRHYKHLAKGDIQVYGNSCTIKENIFGLSDEQKYQMEFQRKLQRPGKPPKRVKGDIKSFSRKSRLRMLKKMNRVDFENENSAYFTTLTYPDLYPTEGEVYKAHLDSILKRLKRSFGNLSYIWKLEAQPNRGAPHYHLIIFFEKWFNIEYVRQWISQNWFEVVQRNWEVKNHDHLKAGTNCKIVTSLRQLINYVTKYLTKKEEDDQLVNQGRYWGCSRNWDDVILNHHQLTSKQLIIFRRLLKSYLRKTNRRMSKKMTNCPNIEVWAPWKFILNALAWSSLMY